VKAEVRDACHAAGALEATRVDLAVQCRQ
jgi:hypothetical protein